MSFLVNSLQFGELGSLLNVSIAELRSDLLYREDRSVNRRGCGHQIRKRRRQGLLDVLPPPLQYFRIRGILFSDLRRASLLDARFKFAYIVCNQAERP